MIWTDEAVETLKAMTKEGHTSTAIAKVLGCGRNAVLGKAHRLKLQTQRNAGAPRKHPREKPKPKIITETGGVPYSQIGPRDCAYFLDNGKCCGERIETVRPRWPYCDHHLNRAKRKCSDTKHQQK
jgi:GcrA cell cycle regulator